MALCLLCLIILTVTVSDAQQCQGRDCEAEIGSLLQVKCTKVETVAENEEVNIGLDESISTVGWDSRSLLSVRTLLGRSSPPLWATTAQSGLIKQALKVVGLPAELRQGVPAGPWSVTYNDATPPSGDKRDYYTWGGYVWPCHWTCDQAGFQPAKCGAWNASLRTFGECNTSSGKPWVSRDGYFNAAGEEDLNALIVTAETMETLTLAWWFAPNHSNSISWARTAAQLIRTFFLDNATGMNPRMSYASAIPGYYDGTAGGMCAATIRLNTRLSDCIELLKTASSEVWTDADDSAWQVWATQWLQWIQTSEFGKIEMGAVGNHATFMYLHKLALAHAIGNYATVLDVVGNLRTDYAGSLAEQIAVSGEMPTETARIMGAIYSRMNIEALFKLGVAVGNVCRALQCSPGLDWDWDWEVADESSSKWLWISDNISYCRYRGHGSTESLEACQHSCEDASNCNGVVTRARTKGGSLVGCYFKECKGNAYLLRSKKESDTSSYNTYMFVEGPQAGTGSVRKALDYLRQYALGTKSWAEDHPHCTDASTSWRTLAVPLRIAAVAYSDPTYETDIKSVDPEGWFYSWSTNALTFPPASHSV